MLNANDSAVRSKLEKTFSNEQAGAPVRCCCKNVSGRWVDGPKPTNINVEYVGIAGAHITYYLKFIPKGVALELKFRATATIVGKLVCICDDDGRTLDEHPFSKKVAVEFIVPAPVNILKRFIPIIGQILTVIDLVNLAINAAEFLINNGALLEPAMAALEKIIEEIRKSATTLCNSGLVS